LVFGRVLATFEPAKSLFIILLPVDVLPHISPVARSNAKHINDSFHEQEWTINSSPSKSIKLREEMSIPVFSESSHENLKAYYIVE